MKKLTSALLVAALLGSFSLVGCSEAERTYDCAQICDSYSTCLDSSIDKSDCTSKCEAEGESDPDFEAKASACENCLDDKDCASATLDCTTKCAEVVLVSTGDGGAKN